MIRVLKPSLLFLLAIPTLAEAAQTEKLVVISNGENVGSIEASTEGRRITVDYAVSDNGRGPKHREQIELGKNGVPTSWTIEGTSLMGGPVQESFRWQAGRATWTSQADEGSVDAAAPKLYIVNDDSPYAAAIYARVALAAKGGVDTLPGGRMTVTKVRDLSLGATPVSIYRLDGSQLAPQYLALDKKGALFAVGNAIRAGSEGELPAFRKVIVDLARERVRAISAKVAHRYDMPVRIRNVRIFDPKAGQLGPLSTVVVMRDTITRILPGDGGAPPADQVIVEGEGGTLYPGLHDMHSHTSLESGLFYLAAGVTGARDMGNKNGFLLDLLPRVESGEIAGPHIVPAGFLEGRSPYSARNGFIPETLDEALENVRWYADHGYREIKIYNSFNPDWVQPVAAEAHRLGLLVTGHIPAFDTPDRAIADGYDSIAHINQLMLGWLVDASKEDTRTPLRLTAMARAADLDLSSPRVRATVKLMKDREIALDTTSVILERLMLSRARVVTEGDVDYLAHMPIGYQRYRKRTFVPLKDAAEDARYQAAFGKLLATMKLLDDNGVQMLPGTDDSTGFTVQREIELYVKAGLTPARALRLATLDSAAFLGEAASRGTIERGKKAEFVLVKGNPLTDIREIKRPQMVLRGGAVYFPSEIYESLSIKPFTTAPSVIVPEKTAVDENDAPPDYLFDSEGSEEHLRE